MGTPHAAVRDVRYEEQDLGPLAWVHAELRKTLDSAVKLLWHFAHEIESSGESDLTSHDTATLRNVRQMLHQCAGALVMVGMEQTALVLRAMEAAVHRLVQEPEKCRGEAVAELESASFAIIEYLDSILAGKNVSPVALFPQYRQVQLLAGVPHVHPMDLWPAERRVREPVFPGTVLPLPYGAEVRSHLTRRSCASSRTGMPRRRWTCSICAWGLPPRSSRRSHASSGRRPPGSSRRSRGAG